jgi:hypothetical protein
MTISRKLVMFAAAFAASMPMAALAQNDPPEADVPDEVYEAQTGTRIQHVVVIGAIRDRNAPQRAERPADQRVPELPVTYEDAPAQAGK